MSGPHYQRPGWAAKFQNDSSRPVPAKLACNEFPFRFSGLCATKIDPALQARSVFWRVSPEKNDSEQGSEAKGDHNWNIRVIPELVVGSTSCYRGAV